jgi:hypothetical protein
MDDIRVLLLTAGKGNARDRRARVRCIDRSAVTESARMESYYRRNRDAPDQPVR